MSSNGSNTDVPRRQETLLRRLYRALGPLAGGMILDFVDLAKFGPLGLALGLPVGIAVGWWICSIYELSWQVRFLVAVVAGIYCMAPFTGVLPLATLISAIARFQPRELSDDE